MYHKEFKSYWQVTYDGKSSVNTSGQSAKCLLHFEKLFYVDLGSAKGTWTHKNYFVTAPMVIKYLIKIKHCSQFTLRIKSPRHFVNEE